MTGPTGRFVVNMGRDSLGGLRDRSPPNWVRSEPLPPLLARSDQDYRAGYVPPLTRERRTRHVRNRLLSQRKSGAVVAIFALLAAVFTPLVVAGPALAAP